MSYQFLNNIVPDESMLPFILKTICRVYFGEHNFFFYQNNSLLLQPRLSQEQ